MLTVALVLAVITIAVCVGMGWMLVRSLKGSTIHPMPSFVVAHTIGAGAGLERSLTFDPASAIDDLVALGFRPAGALRFDLPSHTAVFSILLAPDGDAFAAVTPAHVAICSDFDGKVIDTSSGHAGVAMPYELNHSMKARVDELVASHRTTLARVAKIAGQRPRRLTEQSVMTVALDIERCSLATFSPLQQFVSPLISLGRGLRTGAGPSDRAIERLFERPERWEPIAA